MIRKEDIEKDMSSLGITYYGLFRVDASNKKELEEREKRICDDLGKSEPIECAPEASERFFVLGNPGGFQPTTVVVIAMPYDYKGKCSKKKMGTVDAFAWGYDYHHILAEKLNAIHTLFKKRMVNLPDPEICVDTSRYIDREVAFYAGLGHYGQNHLLIHSELGSAFFIGYLVYKDEASICAEALQPLVLEDDLYEGCRTCNRCIKACPANICGHDQMAPNKCVGMLTQTKRGLDNNERQQIGHRLYGCNVCQRVCPANEKLKVHDILSAEEENFVDLKKLLILSNKDFKAAYGHMAFAWRALWVYKRNALINLGNCGSKEDQSWLVQNREMLMGPSLEETYEWALKSIEDRLR